MSSPHKGKSPKRMKGSPGKARDGARVNKKKPSPVKSKSILAMFAKQREKAMESPMSTHTDLATPVGSSAIYSSKEVVVIDDGDVQIIESPYFSPTKQSTCRSQVSEEKATTSKKRSSLRNLKVKVERSTSQTSNGNIDKAGTSQNTTSLDETQELRITQSSSSVLGKKGRISLSLKRKDMTESDSDADFQSTGDSTRGKKGKGKNRSDQKSKKQKLETKKATQKSRKNDKYESNGHQKSIGKASSKTKGNHGQMVDLHEEFEIETPSPASVSSSALDSGIGTQESTGSHDNQPLQSISTKKPTVSTEKKMDEKVSGRPKHVISGTNSSCTEVKDPSGVSIGSHVQSKSKEDIYRSILDKQAGLSEVTAKSADSNGKEGGADSDAVLKDTSRMLSNSREPQEKNINVPETENVDPDNEEEEKFKVAYYLENFKVVLKTVLDTEDDRNLFSAEDLTHVETFYNISDAARKLYVRLFQRKYNWILRQRIKYPEIREELGDVLQELENSGLTVTESQLSDQETVLHLLPAPELRALAKSLQLTVANQQKAQIVTALLKHGKQKTIGSMFFGKGGGSSNLILKRAKSMLGKCYRLEGEARGVFIRVLMLFSLTSTQLDEESPSGGQPQLFQMLMTNMGKVVYPSYTIMRQSQVFQTREDLIRFQVALQFECDIVGALEKNNLEGAFNMYMEAKLIFEREKGSRSITEHDLDLPVHLRKFTAGAIYVRILTQGVEILQKQRNYRDANTQLEELIQQEVYHLDYRGRWYDRLALNTEQHCKNITKTLEIIGAGLADPEVRVGHRLALYQRAERICNSPSHARFKKQLSKFHHKQVKELPKVTVEGRTLPHGVPGFKTVFVSDEGGSDGDPDDVTLFWHVEDFALSHYRSLGYDQGIHGEASTFSTLFGLYLWDILFLEGIPDSFYNPYQSQALDLETDLFYARRQALIDERLKTIQNSTAQELHAELTESWQKHEGVLCSGVNWERFTDIDHAKGLVTCMGGKVMAGIFERFVKNMRFTRSGVPDLTVWNTENNTFKVVEVKGPGDRLSTKQILWLDYLLELGVDAEVCYVTAVNSKKLKSI